MIELYYAPTPDGLKITLFLEEVGVAYRLVRIGTDPHEITAEAFATLFPGNRTPAIVDRLPVDGGVPVSLCESGAILVYLGEKTGKLLSAEWRERASTLQWLFWQTSGFGPVLKQNQHFTHRAPQPLPYAIERFDGQTQRLYTLLNNQLVQSPWIAGEHYSIADIATWPWVHAHEQQRIDLTRYPAVHNWYTRISSRPATQRALSHI